MQELNQNLKADSKIDLSYLSAASEGFSHVRNCGLMSQALLHHPEVGYKKSKQGRMMRQEKQCLSCSAESEKGRVQRRKQVATTTPNQNLIL